MSLLLRIVATTVAAYFIGGIPFGLLIGKLFYKTDVRRRGSGNIGATNVLRVLGPVAGYSTFALDFLKGAVAVLVADAVVTAALYSETAHQWAQVLAIVAVMLGHTYSPYLKFSGGKGVATAAGGIVVAFAWPVWIAEIVLFVLIVAIWRMVSLGSVAIAVAFPVLILIFYGLDVPYVTFAFGAAAIVIWRHRTNITRIARGTEARVNVFGRSESRDAGGSGKGE